MSSRESIVRVYVVYIIVLLFALLIITKIISIQFFDGRELQKKTEEQTYSIRIIKAPRGNIYADNDQKTSLALSVPRYKIYMDLVTVKNSVFESQIAELADSLENIFIHKSAEQWENDFRTQRAKGNMYYLIASEVKNNELNRLKQFPIFKLGKFSGGLIVVKKNKRVKPYGLLANRTIGYVIENEGKTPILVGLEGAFNEELKGRDGEMLMERIRGNEWKPVEGKFSKDPIPGCDIYSSIDVNIQDVAESALLNQLKDQDALRGCVVLMEVESGFIKAIANLTIDKETGAYYESQNHAVGLTSEPGSTFKLASLMVALDDGKIKISDSIDMTGRYTYYDASLKDPKSYGKNTVQVAFEKSSNVISQIIYEKYKDHPQEFINGLKEIGLHNKLGIPIIGEGKPYIKNADDPLFSGISLPWMSIGYEVQLTPLQVLAFYNAVANDGIMVKPKFVKQIRKGGEVINEFHTEIINPQICKQTTLKSVQIMLKGVVERGTAKNIKARGFDIAGKTGTSKIATGSKGYGNKYQASFCGYFPADNPKYSCIVVIQGPTKNIFGSIVSGTVFKEIADKMYALGSMTDNKIQKEDSYFPFSKHGNYDDLISVLSEMDIPIQKEGTPDNWVTTKAQNDGIKIKNRKIINGLVPNVMGMGLNDALYLLECQGLEVKVKGSGFVKNQSLIPGKKVIKGQLITIDLS